MQKKGINKYQLFLVNLNNHKRIIYLFIVALSLPLVYLLVYETGGAKFVYPHTMYIVIVFAAMTLGAKWGILTGIIGGILIGPLMPLDVLTGSSTNIKLDFQNVYFHYYWGFQWLFIYNS